MAIIASLLASAVVAAERPTPLPPLAVADEHDARGALAAAGRPTLLLPMFTRCTGTCPMTAVALARARPPLDVIVLSFDPGDTAKDLRDFRERFDLPAQWRIVRALDVKATRAFLDDLDFHVMKSLGGFDHPNLTYVFSAKGAWTATLVGSPFDARDFQAALSPSRPVSWLLFACCGLAASLAAIVFARRRA